MFKPLVAVISVLLTGAAAASRAQGTGKTSEIKQFEYIVAKAHIHRAPGAPDWAEATLGFDIKNTGTVAVQIALANPTTLQTDAGHRFMVANQEAVSGLSFCPTADVDYCALSAKNYTRLMPGKTLSGSLALAGVRLDGGQLGPVTWARFSGSLFVREEKAGKAWIEPFTISEVKVRSALP